MAIVVRTPAWIMGAALGLVLAGAGVAAAQQPGVPPDPAAAGPLVVEPLHKGFVLAPDFKATKVDGKFRTLAGAYGAWVKDDHLLVGGAGYWLTDHSHSDRRRFGYGGLVAGWVFRPEARLSFTAKGLAGVGATSSNDTTFWLPGPRFNDRSNSGDDHFRVDNTFLVGEPEGDVQFRITRRISINAGVGYRFVTTDSRNHDDAARGLRGPSGSVSLQFKLK